MIEIFKKSYKIIYILIINITLKFHSEKYSFFLRIAIPFTERLFMLAYTYTNRVIQFCFALRADDFVTTRRHVRGGLVCV